MTSLWKNTVTLPAFPRLQQDLKTDVLIIGGGLTGLLCAYLLTEEGVDCALIEADKICGGVTGNTTAKITSQHGLIYHKLLRRFGPELTRMYLEANEAALERYRRLAETIPCGFETRDNFIYARDDKAALERELSALEKITSAPDFTARLPLPFPVAGAIRFPNQAQFHPLEFAAGIAPKLPIYEHTAARSFNGRHIVTDQGRIQAKKVIVATHFPIFNKHGAYFLKLYQHRSYVLALSGAPDVGGMYMDAAKTGLSFRNCGDLLLLGGGAHRTGKTGGGWDELTSFALTHYPGAKEVCRWAAQDCISLDGVPYIGRYGRGTRDVYVATGFNKWGVTSAMAAAMLLCDMVQERENPYASLFSPHRAMMRPQLAVNAFESAANLLTLSSPRCPHLGCALQWNPQERSWDCPCHGSRFTERGRLLDNPSTGDLKKLPKQQKTSG